MRCVKIEDFDIIASTPELAKALKVSIREVQHLTNKGYLTYISNYKSRENRGRYYRLSVAIREYERYLFEYKGRTDFYALEKSVGKDITIISDIDISKIKENKKTYYAQDEF